MPPKPADPKKEKIAAASAKTVKTQKKKPTADPAAKSKSKSKSKSTKTKTTTAAPKKVGAKRRVAGGSDGCDYTGDTGATMALTNSQSSHFASGLPFEAANPTISNPVLNSMNLSQSGWAWGEHGTQYTGNSLVQSMAYDPANAGSFVGGRVRGRGRR